MTEAEKEMERFPEIKKQFDDLFSNYSKDKTGKTFILDSTTMECEMKREHQETTEECKARADDFLSKLRTATATMVACQVHLEKVAKLLEDDYPEIDTEKEWEVVFDQLNSIGNKLTRYAEEVMEVR